LSMSRIYSAVPADRSVAVALVRGVPDEEDEEEDGEEQGEDERSNANPKQEDEDETP
jgi:hypothetical protein